MTKLLGARIGSYHTLNDWGLLMKVGSPKISNAETEEYLINVPGSDTMLNLTRALDGRPHYKKRTITMELKCIAPKKKWPAIYSKIANALQGKWMQCKFDNDPAWYWEGLWSVSCARAGLYCTFTITGTCNPFKYSVYDGSSSWLWDTFNFEEDIARDYTDIQLAENEATTVTIIGAPRTAAIYFKRSEDTADIAVVVNGSAAGILAKSVEWQYLEGLTLPDDAESVLQITSSQKSSISIRYLGGSL